MDRPDDLPELTERIRENMERPVLSEEQVELYNSGYIDDFEEVLELLEESEQIKPEYRKRLSFS